MTPLTTPCIRDKRKSGVTCVNTSQLSKEWCHMCEYKVCCVVRYRCDKTYSHISHHSLLHTNSHITSYIFTHYFIHIHSLLHTYSHITSYIFTHDSIHIHTWLHTYSHMTPYIFTHDSIHIHTWLHTYSHITSYIFTHDFIHIHTWLHTYSHITSYIFTHMTPLITPYIFISSSYGVALASRIDKITGLFSKRAL